MYLVHH